jgi:2-iminobutanoate/2-iminopropanoate deaminase
MERQWLNPDGVAPPVGSYSHVVTVEVGDGVLAFISGQVAMDGSGQVVAPGDLAGQADFCYRQLDGIVRSLGGTLGDVVKQTTFLTDMSELGSLAEVRSRYLSTPFPASTAVEVSRLAREGLLIEIEAVAAIASPA